MPATKTRVFMFVLRNLCLDDSSTQDECDSIPLELKGFLSLLTGNKILKLDWFLCSSIHELAVSVSSIELFYIFIYFCSQWVTFNANAVIHYIVFWRSSWTSTSLLSSRAWSLSLLHVMKCSCSSFLHCLLRHSGYFGVGKDTDLFRINSVCCWRFREAIQELCEE